jgi:hypothetical protein
MAHIPALTPYQMAAYLKSLAGLPLDPAAKERIALMLVEASHPDRHNVERLDAGRARDRQDTAVAVVNHFRGVMDRATAGLHAISDDEWDALVDEANAEHTPTNE